MSYLPESSFYKLFHVLVLFVFTRTQFIYLLRLIERSVRCRPKFLHLRSFQFFLNDHFFFVMTRTRQFLMIPCLQKLALTLS